MADTSYELYPSKSKLSIVMSFYQELWQKPYMAIKFEVCLFSYLRGFLDLFYVFIGYTPW